MNIVIVGMSSIGIDLYLTLKNEVSNIYLIGKKDEAGMAISGHRIFLDESNEDKIINIVNENIKSDCLLYITTDIFNDLIMDEFETTKQWFNDNIEYIGVDYDFYKRIRDKYNYEDLLKSYGISTPHVYNKPLNLNDVKFPIFSKYNGNKNENYHYKSRLFLTQEEFAHEIKQSYTNSYIYQNYYSPEEYKNFSYGCFAVDGKIVADIYVRQLDQYPQGISTIVVEEIERPESFINSVKMLLRDENYNGFIEFEILTKTEVIVLIDINIRTWGWFDILNLKYEDFPKIVSRKSDKATESKKENLVWMKYHRLIVGLIAKRNFGVIKHVRINKTILNSVYVVLLLIKNGLRGRF